MESPVHGSELIGADPDFHLIETFGYSPQNGVVRLSLHLARLATSSSFFGIPFDIDAARTKINTLQGDSCLRCRMTLTIDGDLTLTTAPMPTAISHWRFAIAEHRLVADDPFLNHKTSQRSLYNQARNALPKGVDEWLFLNEHDQLCEGTITNLVLQMPDDAVLTPPLSSGCLPGVYRQSLLDAGKLREAVLTLQDLQIAKHVTFINALRGKIAASWSPDCNVFRDPQKQPG